MEYKEMKKDELVKLLEEQRHLADAVVAKDGHIENLRGQLDNALKEVMSLKKELHKMLVDSEQKSHLAKSVEDKDKQIVELGILNKKFKDEKEALEVKAKEEKEVLERKIKEEKVALERKVSEITNKANEQEKVVKTLTENNTRLVEMANGYILNFRSMLKSLQGNLELAVELEAMLSEKIKK
jgi:hypothetical protein